MINRFYEKLGELNIKKVILLYLISVVFYSVWMLFFTTPVHVGVDEQLYIAMARSFHYDGNFAVGGELKNYGSILYSMLISLAYFWYSPRTIMLLMRIINVLVELSVVFPIYLVIKEKKLDEIDKWFVILISVILPEVTNAAFMMQEILLYPLFMWTFWLLLKESDEAFKISRSIIVSILLVLCYFTKTSALGFLAGYLMFLFFEFLRDKSSRKYYILKAFITMITAGALLLLEKKYILWCNGGIVAENHYQNQILDLLPIDITLFIEILIGIVFYIVFSLISMGIGMTTSTFMLKKDKAIRLIVCMMFATIVEVVICILCTENRGNYIPNKLYYRYVYYFFIPILICFVKNKEKVVINRVTKIICIICPLLASLYFAIKGKTIIEGIMDADLIGLLVNINNHILSGFAILVMLVLCGIYIFLFSRNRAEYNWYSKYKVGATIGCAFFLIINLFQLPYYSNVIADGNSIKKEAAEISEEIDNQGYLGVVNLEYNKNGYYAMVGSYLKNDVCGYVPENREKIDSREILLVDKSVGAVVSTETPILETEHYLLYING